MRQDPIIEEIHEFRRQHAKQFHFDLPSLVADLRKSECKAKDKLVSRQPRRLLNIANRVTTGDPVG